MDRSQKELELRNTVLHRMLPATSPQKECDRLFKVTTPAAHKHLTRARCHGLLARSSATKRGLEASDETVRLILGLDGVEIDILGASTAGKERSPYES